MFRGVYRSNIVKVCCHDFSLNHKSPHLFLTSGSSSNKPSKGSSISKSRIGDNAKTQARLHCFTQILLFIGAPKWNLFTSDDGVFAFLTGSCSEVLLPSRRTNATHISTGKITSIKSYLLQIILKINSIEVA